MRRFHQWYMQKCQDDPEHIIPLRLKDEDYFNGTQIYYLDFKDIYEVYQLPSRRTQHLACRLLGSVSVLSSLLTRIYIHHFLYSHVLHTDCRMEIQRCRKEGIYDVGFMDTVVINQKTILEFEEDIKDRVLKFFIHQHFKKFILLPYNWGLVSTNSNLVLHITFIIVPSNMLSMFNSLIAQLPLDTAYHRNGKRNYYCA